MNAIKEHQILFSAPMVRAILEGRKTVARRIVKPQYLADTWSVKPAAEPRHERHTHDWWLPDATQPYSALPPYPYGKPGDKLWVRETLRYDCEYGHYFAAGGAHGETVYLCSLFDNEQAQTGYSYDGLLPERTVPSIHHPRRYCRILLEIIDVRVERLQDITGDQAEAEGVDAATCQKFLETAPSRHECKEAVIHGFSGLWASINGPDAWNSNPWVWAIEFKRVTP